MQRILIINTAEWEPLECSAMIMAVMAFPGVGEEDRRRDAFEALVARPLHEQIRLSRDRRPFANSRLNTYLVLKSGGAAAQLCRKISKILVKRDEVGRVATPWILELWKGDNHSLPPLTNNLLMDQVSDILNRSPEMWLKRVWIPARPAFHFFAAYSVAALILPSELKDPFNPVSAPVRAPDTEITKVIAKLAMSFQEKLAIDSRFGFERDELVWLEWK